MRLNSQSWRSLVTSTQRIRLAIILGSTCAAIGVLVGLSLALAGPIITVGMLVALTITVWALTNLEIGLWGIVAIVAVFPFGTLPFKLVLTPTFLDLAMGGVFAVYAMQWMTGQRRRLSLTPLHGLLVAFMLLALFNFIAGLRYAGLTSNVLRHFAELLLSIALALVLVDVLDTHRKLRRLALVVMLGGSAAALLGIVLYALPDEIAEGLLNSLSVLGYPEGGVLRYIEDNPELAERAISTSVDPNALGGFLAMMAAFTAPQLVAPRPLGGRRWLVVSMFAVITIGVILTFSRGAMLALLGALLYIAVIKYRRLLLIIIVVGTLLLTLPFTQSYVERFAQGVQGADLATQMRFGEYSDSIELIARYPVIGVGFSASPDIDLYLGVSSIYLLIAESMGLVGLLAFLIVMGSIFAYASAARRRLAPGSRLDSLLLGLTAALVAALVSGIFDHYFVNIEFHHAVTILWLTIGLTLAAARLAMADNREELLQKA